MIRRIVGAALVTAALAGCVQGAAESVPERPRKSTVTPVPPKPPKPSASASTPTATPRGTLLVADFDSDTVTFVDPARGPVGSVKVGLAPYGIALGRDGRAWVSTAEGVAVVDTATRTRTALIPYDTETGRPTLGEYRGGGMGIALAPDGRHAYVGVTVPDREGVLEVIDTTSGTVSDTVPVGRRPFDVDVSRDGREVYATNHDSFSVTKVDTASLAPRTYEVAPYGTEGGLGSWLKPHYAAVRPSDGALLLPFEGERLAVLDPRTGKVTIDPMTADTHQHGVTITPDGTLLVVGTGPVTDGEPPSLTVRSPDGRERVIPLQGPHENVAVSPDGRTAYVTGGFTREGSWDGITVVDLDSGDTRRLPAGVRPLGIVVL
ncbi:YncE family protein [Streptomyces beijiangensis]|uniref:YncE family protein n=1 Tax=Streptomyces beijiangensis TaxID=163361 RepID=A0A939JH18_9ACTN|nr:YncE family protein [Streptomyces beijiangensis]MBO0511685.1 YncE family protein [Streptomyces beijiangensis]